MIGTLRLAVYFAIASAAFAQEPAGQRDFEARCAACHGGDAAGGERGPSLLTRIASRTDRQLQEVIAKGAPGMPAFPLGEGEMSRIVAFLRSLKPPVMTGEKTVVRLTDGRALDVWIRNQSNYDVQAQTGDGQIHLLRRSAERTEVLPGGLTDWPSYHGHLSGNRHSPLDQINAQNISRLAPAWMFPIPGSQRLQVTPVVIDGVMYVTYVNEAYALDAASGRQIWRYQRPRTKGLVGDAASGINRGVAVLGDRLFMVTDHAHLIALNRLSGELLWDVEMADYRQHYGATSAPLVVGDVVISGISGGDEGVRGFLDAYQASSGKRLWRFWTVPARGEPLAETWVGNALEHGCAATWLTGTYDPALDLLYWPTGNPCPDYNGDERKGDNLYSDSILALKPKTGELKWFYQYTPHDLHDWDSQQTPMLIDADFGGRPRKLLVQANRNGFFYVLDRVTGERLLAKPFVKNLTWAEGIGRDGRPIVIPSSNPTPEGAKACPAVEGATNWMSTAYNPATKLFYVMALEKCNIFTKSPGKWEQGKSYYDGSTRRIQGEPGKKILRALDVETGRIIWEYPQIGPANSWGGVLSTAGGLVFFGDDSGAFAAVDARTGKYLWHFQTNVLWKASPMTYQVAGTQFIAIAAGSSVLSFRVH